MRLLDIAFVGVEPHLAIAQRAHRLALIIKFIGNELHRIVRISPKGALFNRRLYARRNLAVNPGIGELLILGEVLIPDQQDTVLCPGLTEDRASRRINRLRNIETTDFDANHRR